MRTMAAFGGRYGVANIRGHYKIRLKFFFLDFCFGSLSKRCTVCVLVSIACRFYDKDM